MDKVEWWKPQPGEKEDAQAMAAAGFRPDSDPFSVDREVCRQRSYAMIVKWCDEGVLQGIARGNQAAAANFFDQGWAKNSRRFDYLTRLFLNPGVESISAVRGLADAGELQVYGIAKGDADTAQRWFEFIAARRAEQFRAMKERSHVPDSERSSAQ